MYLSYAEIIYHMHSGFVELNFVGLINLACRRITGFDGLTTVCEEEVR